MNDDLLKNLMIQRGFSKSLIRIILLEYTTYCKEEENLEFLVDCLESVILNSPTLNENLQAKKGFREYALSKFNTPETSEPPKPPVRLVKVNGVKVEVLEEPEEEEDVIIAEAPSFSSPQIKAIKEEEEEIRKENIHPPPPVEIIEVDMKMKESKTGYSRKRNKESVRNIRGIRTFRKKKKKKKKRIKRDGLLPSTPKLFDQENLLKERIREEREEKEEKKLQKKISEKSVQRKIRKRKKLSRKNRNLRKFYKGIDALVITMPD